MNLFFQRISSATFCKIGGYRNNSSSNLIP